VTEKEETLLAKDVDDDSLVVDGCRTWCAALEGQNEGVEWPREERVEQVVPDRENNDCGLFTVSQTLRKNSGYWTEVSYLNNPYRCRRHRDVGLATDDQAVGRCVSKFRDRIFSHSCQTLSCDEDSQALGETNAKLLLPW